jgi:uncharacterized membrane protein YphA (DoxX/SURF4 family)
MTIIVNITRILTGLLFIFSGLVKANDPLGLSYKMQEFFDLWGMSQFNNLTLALSVIVIAFEIIAGVALLLGWKMKLFSWLLLLLILFFTFLTGYAFLSGKFQNCGCFGDCIPISPKQSFIKDLVLLVMIAFLFWKRNTIRPLFNEKTNWLIMLVTTAASFGIQIYMLNFLPAVDCLPFKKGNSISEKMKIPAGAKPDSFAIRFIYSKQGREFEFSPSELPADLASYKFVRRTDKLIRKGNAEPPIKGFALTTLDNIDSTQAILSLPQAVLIFIEEFDKAGKGWKKDFEKIYAVATAKKLPSYLVTAQPGDAKKLIAGTGFSEIPVMKCDHTAIRTAARANPTIYLLENGSIKQKWSYRQFNSAQAFIEKMP